MLPSLPHTFIHVTVHVANSSLLGGGREVVVFGFFNILQSAKLKILLLVSLFSLPCFSFLLFFLYLFIWLHGVFLVECELVVAAYGI